MSPRTDDADPPTDDPPEPAEPPTDAGPSEAAGQGTAAEAGALTRFIMFEPAGVPAEVGEAVERLLLSPTGDSITPADVGLLIRWIATLPRADDPNPLTWGIVGSELGRDRKNATRRFYGDQPEPELHVAVSENAWRPERPPIAPFSIPSRVGAGEPTLEPES